MKVILLKDIKDLGKKGDIKEVKDGFALNFLIPKGLAKRATQEKIAQLEKEKKEKETKEEKELKKIQEIVSKIDGQEITLKLKTGEKGQFFESVTPAKIQAALKELGFKVKRKQVVLEKPIKELGEFPVKIKFKHNLEAEITVIVEEKEES